MSAEKFFSINTGLKSRHSDFVVLVLSLAGVTPAINLLIQMHLFDYFSEFFHRRIWLPLAVAILVGFFWLVFREKMRSAIGVLFPRTRLGALWLFLCVGYLSQLFFGFWHSGIAGWTYEAYGLERIAVEEPAADRIHDFAAYPEPHFTVLQGSFRAPTRAHDVENWEGPICWKQDAIVADVVPRGKGAESTESLLISPESLGFVFPSYIHRNDPQIVNQTLSALIQGKRAQIPWGQIEQNTGWIGWRYWSHTPAIAGQLDFGRIESFEGIALYRITSCITSTGALSLSMIRHLHD